MAAADVCLGPEGESFFFLSGTPAAAASTLLLSTCFGPPPRFFDLFKARDSDEAFRPSFSTSAFFKSVGRVLFLTALSVKSQFEHVHGSCAEFSRRGRPVRPLHIPGNTNINFFFFFPRVPLWMLMIIFETVWSFKHLVSQTLGEKEESF